MRCVVLALVAATVACGTRTELPNAEQLGMCGPAFATGISAFDLTPSEVVVLSPPGVVALDKRTASARVVANTDDGALFIATNGTDVAWTTRNTGVYRTKVAGGPREELLAPGWNSREGPRAEGLAINAAGTIILTTGRRTAMAFEPSRFLSLGGRVAVRGDRVVGFRPNDSGDEVAEQHLDSTDPRALLSVVPSAALGRFEPHVRIGADDTVWVASGRPDVSFAELSGRIDHIHTDGSTHLVHAVGALRAVSVDADRDDSYVAIVGLEETDEPRVRIDHFTNDGAVRRQFVQCVGPLADTSPELRVDAEFVWLLLKSREFAYGTLYRFAREPK